MEYLMEESDECCINCVNCGINSSLDNGEESLFCWLLYSNPMGDEVQPDHCCDNFYYREDDLVPLNEEETAKKLELLRKQ